MADGMPVTWTLLSLKPVSLKYYLRFLQFPLCNWESNGRLDKEKGVVRDSASVIVREGQNAEVDQGPGREGWVSGCSCTHMPDRVLTRQLLLCC